MEKDENLLFLESIDECVSHMGYFINSEFDECIAAFAEKKDTSMYHHFGYATFSFVQSFLTMDRQIMGKALKETELCLNAYNKKYRRQNSMLSSKNFDNYSDQEVHAELSYSVVLTANAVLGVIYDPSFTGFVKSAYRMTSGYMGLREALQISQTRKCWSHPRIGEHYEAFVKMILGLFEIIIAFMPAKLSRLLDVIGFSGRLENAIELLETSFKIKNTFGGICSGLALVFLNAFAEFFYGVGEPKIQILKEVQHDQMTSYPHSVYTAGVTAMVHLLEGRFNEALEACDQVQLTPDKHPEYVHYMFMWIKSWSLAFQCNWKAAAAEMKGLTECKWSPALFNYFYASFLFMQISKDDDDVNQEVTKIFAKIPTLRKRIGGRKVFHDNFVIDRAHKYSQPSRQFFLPAYELLYIWNFFKILAQNKKSVETVLEDIKIRLEMEDDEEACSDNHYNLLFLKAMVLKHARQPEAAKKLYMEILNQSKRLTTDRHLIAHSAYEIGMIYRDSGDDVTAQKWITQSKKSYSGYLTQSLLHFRADIVTNKLCVK